MKLLLKTYLDKYFSSFLFFYRKIGYRIFVTVGLSIIVSILDGFGLAMFLPLLQMVSGDQNINSAGMGNLSFITDAISATGLQLNLNSVLLFLCIFFILKGGAKFISGIYNVIVRQFFIKRIRLSLLNDMSKITYKYFVLSDAGKIENTMTGEADRVMRANTFFIKAVEQIVMVLVYMVLAFFVDIRFALLVSVGGVLTNFIFNVFYKLTKTTSGELTKNMHGFQGEVIQYIGNFKYLKATGLLFLYANKLKSSVERIEINNKKIGFYQTILEALREPLLIIVVAIVIFLQVNVLKSPLGPIILSLLFFYRALTSLLTMQTAWNSYLGLTGSLDNVIKFQDELKVAKEKKGNIQIEQFKNQLFLNNVNFKFDVKPILKNISLSINCKETVAFVGESGSGKTTLISLIAGLLPMDTGTYTIDTTDVNELNIISFQKRIGYITQEPVIFNDTIFNNVTFWADRSPQNLNRFYEATKMASIYDFIDGLENKEHAMLGNNGINLSGGQRQRISIARELYKDIDILILDEATSSLDSETEKEVQKSIQKLQGEYTILIVAHRLSTVKDADKIVFLHQGEILNINSFQDLLINQPKFKRMVELQEL